MARTAGCTTAVLLDAVLVLWLMVLPFRDFVAPPDNPAALPGNALLVTRVHALFGTATLLFGLFVMLRGNGLVPRFLRFENYKAYMRVSYALYMITTLIGVFVYITWFVGNPTRQPNQRPSASAPAAQIVLNNPR